MHRAGCFGWRRAQVLLERLIASPDEHFILDRHPAMDDAFIAAGFSGHGYKFCSVIGRVMADFCLGEEGKWGVEGFGVGEGRF